MVASEAMCFGAPIRRLGVDLLQFSFPDGLHDEASWAGRIHVPFQFFFGRAWSAARAR